MIIVFYILYSSVILSFFYLLYKYKIKTLYFLPLFWMISEMLSTYFYAYDSNATINILTFIYISYSIFKIGFKILFFNIFLLLFLLIAFIKTPFNIDYLSFSNRYMNLFNIYMILPISYYSLTSFNDIKKINKILQITLLITILYIIISSLLKSGPNMYETGIIYGLNWSQFYGPALMSVILLVIDKSNNKFSLNKILSFVMIIITIFTFRRTAILIIILFFFTYSFLTLKGKNIMYLLIAIILLSVSYYSITKLPSLKNSDRLNVFSSKYNIEEEGRYYDIFGVYDIMKKDNATLYGYELFNEYGNYGMKRDTRPIHVDIMRIFFGIGFIGIIPLIFCIGKITYIIIKFQLNKNIKSIGLALIVVFILTLFTGGTLYISYSGLVFIYMGGVLKLINIYNSKKIYNNNFRLTSKYNPY